MDIKLICNCGTKYEFEVEPVHGRMPAPVNCPSCGAEGTALANEYIQRSIAPAPTPSPARAPAPIRVTVPPPAPALRINRPASPPPPESPPDDPGAEAQPHQTVAGDAAAPPIAGRPPRRIAPASRAETEPKGRVVQVLTLIVSTILIVFGAWKFGDKWFRRLGIVSDIARVAGEASVKDATESEGAKNLWYDNCSILFIRATNDYQDYQVADACQQYWKEKWNKRVMVINSPREALENGEYELTSAHNGYLCLVGSHEWAYPELEGLAQHLSQKFGTMVIEWSSESFADTYHFGVYDQGARKFHAQMDIKGSNDNAEEVVTTQGNDFAIANGYKPGKDGFKEFNVLDADRITQRLGMKLWDEPKGKELKGMFLKEVGTVAK